MAVENPLMVLESIERDADNRAFLYDAVSRVTPAAQCFELHSTEEFMEQTSSILGMTIPCASQSPWVQARLAGPDVERLLDIDVLEAFPAGRNTRIDLLLNGLRDLVGLAETGNTLYWLALSQGRRGSRLLNHQLGFRRHVRRRRRGSGLYAALGEGHCDADVDAATKPT